MSRMRATLINAGTGHTSIAVYAVMAQAPDPTPIAWFSAPLAPNSYTVFAWRDAYEYVWARTGPLTSGQTVQPAQRLGVAAASNGARLERLNGGYRLVPAAASADDAQDSMSVAAAGDVGLGEVTVGVNLRFSHGIGQPGGGISVVQAQPNLRFVWKPVATYYAAYGAIGPSEYDPPAITSQTPLALAPNGGDFAVMLSSSNVLVQLSGSEATNALTAQHFRRDAQARAC